MKLLFTISLFIGHFSIAQTITIKNTEGEPISGVFIYSKEHQKGIVSGEKGEVDLKLFDEEEVLYFTHLQYETLKITKSHAVTNGVTMKMEDHVFEPIYLDHPLRYNIDKDDEAGQIETISREIVKIENPPTSADMLQNTGTVTVQKSQGGGGSPIIRGFEANKLLLVIDGVRMNNAIYRSGHLQNSITIDNAVLDHTEIIFGPSSSLYGSDALGGVIHFHTKDPIIVNKDSTYFNGSSNIRYNTNNNSFTGHFDFSIGKNKWGLLSSFSASRFGDIIMGENRVLHGDSTWGLHPEYVTQFNGQDSIVPNPDPTMQLGTGYTQLDFLQKFKYQLNNHMDMTLNFQYSTSSNIDRYDKLTEYRNDELRWAEWYYGPQNRLLAQLKFDFNSKPRFGNEDKKRLFNTGALSIAFQKIDEDRISRRFQSTEREHQEEDLNVYSLNLDFNKVFTKSRVLFYGLEAQYNYVQSTAYAEQIFTSDAIDVQTRYPQISHYLSSGLYVEYRQKFKNSASLTTGLRYSLIYANSEFDTTFIVLPFSTVNLLTSAPSGHIGLVLKPDSLTRIRFQGTTGFRAPNVDDYGKVFEKSGITVVPNDNLKPEYAFGLEATGERSFFDEWLSVGTSIYGTYLVNAMVQRDFQLNGQDSILYQGINTKIQAIQNTDNAIIYGLSSSLHLKLYEGLNFDFTYNYTVGRDLANNTPMEHIPPQFGKIALRYHSEKVNTAIYTYYNFRKRANDYAPGGDNIDLTPNEGGTPPWWTLNARFGYTFWEVLTVQAALENILDFHYRQFASGISQPGRNFMFSVKTTF